MTARNACFDRPPFAQTLRVQDGWQESGPSRVPVMKTIPFRMTPECVYGKDTSEDARRGRLGAFDARCAGCKWQQQPKEQT